MPARATVVTARMAELKAEPDLSVICTAMHGGGRRKGSD